MVEAMSGILHVRKIVDDVIAYDSKYNYTEHGKQVGSILQRCVDKCISLKREKFVFAQHFVAMLCQEMGVVYTLMLLELLNH